MFACSSGLPLQAQWSTATLSQPRLSLAATAVGSKAFFAGGADASYTTASATVDIYDVATRQWSTAMLSQARSNLAATSVGSKAFFAGGRTIPSPSNRVDVYNTTTGEWTIMSLSQARSNLAATSSGTKAFFAGGYGAGGASNVVDIYDTTTGLWTTASLSEARYRLTATSVGDKVFFAGGFNNSGAGSGVVDIYTISTGLWTRESLSAPRADLVATSVAGKAFFAGGGQYAQVDIYDTKTARWSQAMLSKRRSSFAATSVGTKAIFAGGYKGTADLADQLSDVVDIYDATTELWTTTTLSQSRDGLAATTAGDQAFFAGGLTNTTNPSTSGVVDIYQAEETVPPNQTNPVNNRLQVRLMGNPVFDKTATVEISGVIGQPLHIELITLLGQVIGQATIDQSASTEFINLALSDGGGVFLVKVSTENDQQVVKLVKL